jgi:hypothetical protein
MFATYINYLEELIQYRGFLTFALLAIGILMAMLFIRFLFNRIMSYFNKDKKQVIQPTFSETKTSSLNNNQFDLDSETATTATHPEVEDCFSDNIKVPEHIKENLTSNFITSSQIDVSAILEDINSDNIDNDDTHPKIEVLESINQNEESVELTPVEESVELTPVEESVELTPVEEFDIQETTEYTLPKKNVNPLIIEEVIETKNVITIEDIEELDLALDEL